MYMALGGARWKNKHRMVSRLFLFSKAFTTMKTYYQKVLTCMLATLVCFNLVSCGDDKDDDIDIPYNDGETISKSMLQKYKWITRDYAFHDYDDWMELTEDVLIYFFISDTEGYLRQIHKWIDSSGFDDEGNNIDNIYFTYKVNGNTVRIMPYQRTNIFLTFDGTYLKDGSYYYQPVDISASDRNQIGKYYGTTGSCSWYYDSGLKGLIISGDGPMKDYAAGSQPWKNLNYSNVFIEDGVTHIGNHAFYNNAGLTDVWIDNDESSLESIGVEAFANTSLEEIRFPNSLETIGTGAFQGCKYLENAIFVYGTSIKSIGDFAFNETKILKKKYNSDLKRNVNRILSLEATLEELGKYAYSGDIEKIEIGSNLKKIGACAFVTSVSSGSLYINRGTPPSADGVVTSYDEGWTLYVPKGSKSAYQRSAPWRNFKKIVEDSNLTTEDGYVPGEDDDDNDVDDNNSNDRDARSGQTFTVTANGVQFKMIGVSGGTFTMGATSEQGSDANGDEKPAHQVTLSSYSIGETEVTQALWQAVMGYSPTSDGSKWTSKYGLGDDYPAYYVSWNDCQSFITKLNQLTGRTFRLPTEAEWEYAARGGNQSKNYKYSGSNTIGDVAWYSVNSYDLETSNSNYGTHEVKTKQANELGIYDMSGNVNEWCNDWYGSSYYSSSSNNNPTGPNSGSYRVRRGGSWNFDARYCRVSNRFNNAPTSTYYSLGLRLAL